MTGNFALCFALLASSGWAASEARAEDPKAGGATASVSVTASAPAPKAKASKKGAKVKKAAAPAPVAAPPPADAEKSWSGGEESDGFRDTEDDPSRLWLSLGAGASLRLAQNRDFAQDAFAPSFIDAFGAWVLPGSGFWRHGVGLGVSTNLVGDGGVLIGVDSFEELVLTPTYLARLQFSPDLIGTLKVGVPWALSPNNDLGFEGDIGGVWVLTSSFGLYAEVGVSLFIGGDGAVSPLASGELGVVIDYEVLP